jgi:hypothetical protein
VRFDGLVLSHHAPVGGGIFFGKLPKFRTGAIYIVPLGYITAVGERHVHDGIGIDVYKTIIAQFEFVIAKQRVLLSATVW